MVEPIRIETDASGRTVLPGHTSQRFLMCANEDGSIVLQPARLAEALSRGSTPIQSCVMHSPAPAPRRPYGDPGNADNCAL
jgi:hypothetical protein